MIIDKIILNNLGPFIGENIINIKYSDDKPIKLIGGKNGAGKTTLFNSLKIGMYGCKAFGYEVNNANYFNKIAKLINDKVSMKDGSEASVFISIRIDDGEHFGEYSIQRLWRRLKTSFLEEKRYFLNGKILSEEEGSNFENLLIHLIPPSLFDFYFFDGEKIGDVLTDDGSTTNFKNAFVKICGLDNIDYLIQCFKNNSDKASKNKTIVSQFEKAKSNYEICKNKVNELKNKISLVEAKIADNNELLSKLKKDYAKIGGVSPSQWKELNIRINDEENNRDKLRRELKDIANNYLPFIICKTNIYELRKYLSSINVNCSVGKAVESFQNENIKKAIINCFKNGDAFDEAIIILKSFDTQIAENYYSLSTNELIRVLNQIDEKISFDENRIFEIESLIKESLEKTKQYRLELGGMNLEEYDNFSQKCLELTNENITIVAQKESYNNELINLLISLREAESFFDRAKKEYEEDIKRVSVHNISLRGYICFSELSKKLYHDYIYQLKANFQKYFRLLINKEHLVDGIYVSDDLSVYPYRMISTTKEDVLRMINDIGKDNFINKVGDYAYSIFKNNRKKEFMLPMKIKGTLSEGENQVYLMALYLSLTKLSKNRIPFIIDTPFGRIDKDHRTNILKSFFANLDGEMIILSTDEEINNENIDQIKNRINSVNLFQNNGNGRTLILDNKYFEGVDL